MIVFWRLMLAYYICAVLFYNRSFFAWRARKPFCAAVVQAAAYFGVGAVLCGHLLELKWPLLGVWPVSGWIGLAAVSLFQTYNNGMWVFRAGQQKGHVLTFLAHDFQAWLFVFLCSPLRTLYETGNPVPEPWAVFCVGVLTVTKIFSVFIYMTEQDLYGRDEPAIDESFVTMLMRLIFYLIALLPGWRWAVWCVVWLLACRVARRNRLLDFSRFALYFGAAGATAAGFLARWSFYLQ